jgi:hypothetical protein
MKKIFSLCFIIPAISCFAQDQYSTRDLKEGKFKDDSSFIYSLPFQDHKKVFLIQGYESKIFSHKGERALDFKVKQGTKICAASGGVVIALREDSDKGALRPIHCSF